MLSTAETCNRMRDVIQGITGIERAFSAGDSGRDGLPDAINEYPAVLVVPGITRQYLARSQGAHRHEYELMVQVMQTGVPIAERVASVCPLVDRVLDAFAGAVKLGGTVDHCTFERSDGLISLDYSGREYYGYQLRFIVSESENIQFAPGAPPQED